MLTLCFSKLCFREEEKKGQEDISSGIWFSGKRYLELGNSCLGSNPVTCEEA